MLRIGLSIGAPCAPTDCGEGNDFRSLGFGLRSVLIEPPQAGQEAASG